MIRRFSSFSGWQTLTAMDVFSVTMLAGSVFSLLTKHRIDQQTHILLKNQQLHADRILKELESRSS